MLLNLRFALGLALLSLIFAYAPNASATGHQDDPNSLEVLSAVKSGNSGPLHTFGANLHEAGGTPDGEKGKPSKCDGCLAVTRANEHVKEDLKNPGGGLDGSHPATSITEPERKLLDAGGMPGGIKGKPCTGGPCLAASKKRSGTKRSGCQDEGCLAVEFTRQVSGATAAEKIPRREHKERDLVLDTNEGVGKRFPAPGAHHSRERVRVPFEAAVREEKMGMALRIDNLERRGVGQIAPPGIRGSEPDPAYCLICGGCC